MSVVHGRRRLRVPGALLVVGALAGGGCASSDEEPLPRVEPTQRTSDAAPSSTSPSSTATPTPAGWTPAGLPADAPEPTPLDPTQKRTYEAYLGTYENEYRPLVDALARQPKPASRARDKLAPYSVDPILGYTVRYSDHLYQKGFSAKTASRVIWRSPQEFSTSRLIWVECVWNRVRAFKRNRPFKERVVGRSLVEVTIRKVRGAWMLANYDDQGETC